MPKVESKWHIVVPFNIQNELFMVLAAIKHRQNTNTDVYK
jgi:hypothetical protein